MSGESEQSTLSRAVVPSQSTSISSLAGAVAVIFVSVMHSKGIDFDAGVEVSIGVVTMAVVSYAHNFAMVFLEKYQRGKP